MKIVAISDTHRLHNELRDIPYGDVIVHAGDATNHGTPPQLVGFLDWFGKLPHKHKVYVAGNHDFGMQTELWRYLPILKEYGIHYLQDSGVTLDGVRFWGSPGQPNFKKKNWAFNLSEDELAEKWALIPEDTQVLVTHGPPCGIRDMVLREGCALGSVTMRARLPALKDLKVHVFGHIHDSYGVAEQDGVRFVNAAICNEGYKPVNLPHMVIL